MNLTHRGTSCNRSELYFHARFSTPSRFFWTTGSLKESRGGGIWPSTDEVLRAPHPLQSSQVSCLHWTPPSANASWCSKRYWPLVLYGLLAFWPPPRPNNSPSFKKGCKTGNWFGTGGSGRCHESFLSKDLCFIRLFLVAGVSSNNTSETKTDFCCITHLKYCKSLFKGSSNNYKDNHSLCWICACILINNGDREKCIFFKTLKSSRVGFPLLPCWVEEFPHVSRWYKRGEKWQWEAA